MKARFSFSTRAWMLSAATGLILVPTLRLMAQESTAEDTPKVSAPAKSLQRDPQPRLKSAVQRELEKLYARDGKKAPELTIQAAAKEAANPKLRTTMRLPSKSASDLQASSRKPSYVSRMSAEKPAKRKPVTKSKIPGLLNLKRLFPKSTQSANKNRPISNSHLIRKPATQKPVVMKNSKLTIQRTSQVVSETSKDKQSRTSGVKQAAAETSPATDKESEIQRKLRELYNRDGRDMPR